jgi:polyphosphate kinase 2 (PPK2 family)
MLENIDLTLKVDNESYKERMADLSDRLYFVQQGSWAAGVPVIILFEGWDAAGKGTTIHKLTDPIDPRGYKIYPIRAARTYEKKHPWLWRFWLKLPARGEWAIFDRSWYGRVLVERMLKLIPKNDWELAYRDIVDFERNLIDDGALILKFFLHISKKEQGKRFEKLSEDKLNAWRVTDEDWRNHKRYDKWLRVYEEMLERTETEWAPWTIVEATDKRHTHIKVYETIIHALEERLHITPVTEALQAPAGAEIPVTSLPEPKEPASSELLDDGGLKKVEIKKERQTVSRKR